MERLDKILANTGRWSRKEARELVRAGRVAVDGVTAQAADGKYDPAARFEVDGETVSGERLVYLMLLIWKRRFSQDAPYHYHVWR